jgi:hypothetical protein
MKQRIEITIGILLLIFLAISVFYKHWGSEAAANKRAQAIQPLTTGTSSDSTQLAVKRPREAKKVATKPSRFSEEFETLRSEQLQLAGKSLTLADSLIVDFSSEELNSNVKIYQALSWQFKRAVESDDIDLIRNLSINQSHAFKEMVTKVAPLAVEDRERFNKYFFAVGEAWASLLLACGGADLPTATSLPAYPEEPDLSEE